MIAHLDADAFFASVLVRKHPNLRGKPLLAVGMSGGCVIAATYEAKAFGVKTGMRLREARILVPDATFMPADFRETALASEQIESILKNLCPIVEQASIDEWFLDLSSLVGGDPKDPERWATEIRLRILRETDLSMSVGIAATKILAKMASEYRKPAGISVVEKRDIQKFLKDRPATAIPGIGRQRKIKTDARSYETAWDIACAPDAVLREICGKTGIELKRELLGERVYMVSKDTRPPKSISRCRTFRATTEIAILKAHLLKHLEYCTMKMRRQDLMCRDISVHVRTADYAYTGTHHRFDQPCVTATQMMPKALSLLQSMTTNRTRWNQVGLTLSGVSPAGLIQQSIFDDPTASINDERLQAALDTIQTRFGRDSVTRAAALSVKSGTRRDFDLSTME